MKKITIFAASLMFTAFLAQAVTMTPGTPENGASASSTGPTPLFGTRFSFDSLTPNTTFSPATYAAQGVSSISSPDGLVVSPFSTQSGPNELFDNSADGSASITITLGVGTDEMGIGIADSDGAPITLEALTSTGTVLGSSFSITLPSSTVNPFNGYFVLSDPGYDIFGLKILHPAGNANYSGLAIDDLQVNPVPEPTTLAMLAAGAAVVGAFRARARRRA